MKINILVVDDVLPIAQGFATTFKRTYWDKYSEELEVEVVCDPDDAVQRLRDQSKPSIHLLFTDIDLSGEGDKNGVAVAKFAKRLYPDLPLVGCSGRFEDQEMSEDDIQTFDRWWSKARLFGRLDEVALGVIDLAVGYKARVRSLDLVSEVPLKKLGLETPQSPPEFIGAGFSLRTIDPSSDGAGLIKEPFAVWVKASEEGVELEVYGCGALFSYGDSYDDAIDALIENISDFLDVVSDPVDTFTPSMLAARDFVKTVTGHR